MLIDEAIKQGVEVEFEVAVESVEFGATPESGAKVTLSNGEVVEAKFVVDGSGYGRVLPRMLDLEIPSCLSDKKAYFTHIEDNISEILYDRQKILITTHPDCRAVWFWLIPFSNGRCSIGVVGEPQHIDMAGLSDEETLKYHAYKAPLLARLLNNAKWDTPVRTISSYSKDVKTLHGNGFLLLGNASEFLDPVFSSGVSIAMYSAKLASALIPRILNGEKIDLETEYTQKLMVGINAFRTYVQGWYNGDFQDVIYTPNENQDVKRQICSILAGYAWDTNNPYVKRSDEALRALKAYV